MRALLFLSKFYIGLILILAKSMKNRSFIMRRL